MESIGQSIIPAVTWRVRQLGELEVWLWIRDFVLGMCVGRPLAA